MKSITEEEILNMCEKWGKKLKVKAKKIEIKNLKRKWGCCYSDGTIILSKDLLKLPPELVEYVIVHELLHLIIPNHGRTFKTLLYAYLPNWDKLHKELENFEKNNNL
jgi:predicted metal-dependent hydrolase